MASNSFCRLTSKLPKKSLSVALICLPLILAQGNGHLTVGAIQKVAGKRNDVVQAKIPVTVDPGFHVNSNTPSEEYLIPLKVTWTAKGVLDGGELVYPKPAMMKLAGEDKPLSVFQGSFDIQANFKVAANATAGPGAASGKLSYQACNDKMCFPPKTVEITVPYQVN